MSMARFTGDQMTLYRVPGAFICLTLGVSVSWSYKLHGGPAKRQHRRAPLDAVVAEEFPARRDPHGSPRIVEDLRAKVWNVSEKTVADSMRRQGLIARIVKSGKESTRREWNAPIFPDLVNRDFTPARIKEKGLGDITEIPTLTGKPYLATVIDLYSRRLLAVTWPFTVGGRGHVRRFPDVGRNHTFDPNEGGRPFPPQTFPGFPARHTSLRHCSRKSER